MKNNIKITIPRGVFHISIEELKAQLRGGGVNVGKSGVTHSKAGSVKVPEGTFHSSGIEGGINNLKNMFGFCDDAIEKAKAAAERIYRGGVCGNSEARVEQEINVPPAVTVSGQWYERDADRFAIEISEMENRGFKLIDLFDGRVGFEKTDEAAMTKITVICDWLYPMKPPALHVENGAAAIGKMKRNADGSIALFSKYMPWRADMAACTVIDYFEEKLEMIKDIEPAFVSRATKTEPAAETTIEPQNSELPGLSDNKLIIADNEYNEDRSNEERTVQYEAEEIEHEENNFQILKSI